MSVVSEEINKNIVNNLNSNIISSLKQRKSRINALRIWKLFVLSYLSDLKYEKLFKNIKDNTQVNFKVQFS